MANVVQPGAGMGVDPATLDAKAVKDYAGKAEEQTVVAFLLAITARLEDARTHGRLAVAMETVRAFGDYVRERHPARAMDFIDMIQAFAPELQKRFA